MLFFRDMEAVERRYRKYVNIPPAYSRQIVGGGKYSVGENILWTVPLKRKKLLRLRRAVTGA